MGVRRLRHQRCLLSGCVEDGGRSVLFARRSAVSDRCGLADNFYWTKPKCIGSAPPVTRAHTCTAFSDRLFVIGGGDGPNYSNDVYFLDTRSSISCSLDVNRGADILLDQFRSHGRSQSSPEPRRLHVERTQRYYIGRRSSSSEEGMGSLR